MFITKREFNKIKHMYTTMDIITDSHDYNSYHCRKLRDNSIAFLVYSKAYDIGLVLLEKTVYELIRLPNSSDTVNLTFQKDISVFLKSPLDYIIEDAANPSKSILIPVKCVNQLDNYLYSCNAANN